VLVAVLSGSAVWAFDSQLIVTGVEVDATYTAIAIASSAMVVLVGRDLVITGRSLGSLTSAVASGS